MPENGDEEDAIVYTVADVAEDKTMLGGSHPLVDMTLCFELKVTEVRETTAEGIEHGHMHGEHDLGVVDEDEDDDKPHILR